ncbi:MAG: hypothetical protein WC683_15100 [bacterium]
MAQTKHGFQTALEWRGDAPLEEKIEFVMRQNAHILRELQTMKALIRMEISDGR